MAVPTRVLQELAAGRLYVVYRADEGADPSVAPLFYPPHGSDELFDALRSSFPKLKTHSERVRDATIQFLMEERVTLAGKNTAPSYPVSAVSDIPPSFLSTPSVGYSATPASTSSSPNLAPPRSLREPSVVVPGQTSPLSLDQMTGVFCLSTAPNQRQKMRRKMTEAEKIEYRKRRIVKACDNCAKRKRKCHHNHPDGDNITAPVAASGHRIAKTHGSSARVSPRPTKPPQRGDSCLSASSIPQMQDFDLFSSSGAWSGVSNEMSTSFDKLPDFDMDHFLCFDEPPDASLDWLSTATTDLYSHNEYDQAMPFGGPQDFELFEASRPFAQGYAADSAIWFDSIAINQGTVSDTIGRSSLGNMQTEHSPELNRSGHTHWSSGDLAESPSTNGRNLGARGDEQIAGLHDLSSQGTPDSRQDHDHSSWFTRGWVMQEMIDPNWNKIRIEAASHEPGGSTVAAWRELWDVGNGGSASNPESLDNLDSLAEASGMQSHASTSKARKKQAKQSNAQGSQPSANATSEEKQGESSSFVQNIDTRFGPKQMKGSSARADNLMTLAAHDQTPRNNNEMIDENLVAIRAANDRLERSQLNGKSISQIDQTANLSMSKKDARTSDAQHPRPHVPGRNPPAPRPRPERTRVEMRPTHVDTQSVERDELVHNQLLSSNTTMPYNIRMLQKMQVARSDFNDMISNSGATPDNRTLGEAIRLRPAAPSTSVSLLRPCIAIREPATRSGHPWGSAQQNTTPLPLNTSSVPGQLQTSDTSAASGTRDGSGHRNISLYAISSSGNSVTAQTMRSITRNGIGMPTYLSAKSSPSVAHVAEKNKVHTQVLSDHVRYRDHFGRSARSTQGRRAESIVGHNACSTEPADLDQRVHVLKVRQAVDRSTLAMLCAMCTTGLALLAINASNASTQIGQMLSLSGVCTLVVLLSLILAGTTSAHSTRHTVSMFDRPHRRAFYDKDRRLENLHVSSSNALSSSKRLAGKRLRDLFNSFSNASRFMSNATTL